MLTFEIHESNLEAFEDKIHATNRRLERNNISERFHAERIGERVKESNGVIERWFEFELSSPTIGYDNWVFVAAIEVMEGGTFLSVAPGQETPSGFERPDTHHCDHCNSSRYRVKSYILRNEATGAIKQVGSNCIELFLGVKVKGLWMLGAFSADELAELREPCDGWDEPSYYSPRTYSVDYLLRMAWAVSNGGRKFVSKRTAEMYDKEPTSNEVMFVINFRPNGRRRDYTTEAYVQEMRDAASNVPDEVIQELRDFAYTLGESDYAENLRVCLDSTGISQRAIGTLVSLVGTWYREQEKIAQRKIQALSYLPEFVGMVKDRLRDIPLTIVSANEFEGDYGVTTLFIMKDEAGHAFKWSSSKAWPDLNAGDQVVLTGTVKAHNMYGEIFQTVLTRCTLEKV